MHNDETMAGRTKTIASLAAASFLAVLAFLTFGQFSPIHGGGAGASSAAGIVISSERSFSSAPEEFDPARQGSRHFLQSRQEKSDKTSTPDQALVPALDHPVPQAGHAARAMAFAAPAPHTLLRHADARAPPVRS